MAGSGDDRDTGLQLDGLRVRFGDVAAPKAQKGSYIVDGHASTLDLAAWIGLIGRDDTSVVPSAAAAQANTPAAPASTHSGLSLDLINRSEEHTSELQSLMRISYAVFCLKKKTTQNRIKTKVYIT